MRHIPILLQLEILGHFAVLALPQILTHTTRGECVVRILMTRTTIVPLAMGPRHLRPSSVQHVLGHHHHYSPSRVVPRSPRAYSQESGGTGLGQGDFHTPVAGAQNTEATRSVSLTPSLPSPAPDSGFSIEDAPPPAPNANEPSNIPKEEMIRHLASSSSPSASQTRRAAASRAAFASASLLSRSYPS